MENTRYSTRLIFDSKKIIGLAGIYIGKEFTQNIHMFLDEKIGKVLLSLKHKITFEVLNSDSFISSIGFNNNQLRVEVSLVIKTPSKKNIIEINTYLKKLIVLDLKEYEFVLEDEEIFSVMDKEYVIDFSLEILPGERKMFDFVEKAKEFKNFIILRTNKKVLVGENQEELFPKLRIVVYEKKMVDIVKNLAFEFFSKENISLSFQHKKQRSSKQIPKHFLN
jgi:hypothetical protein